MPGVTIRNASENVVSSACALHLPVIEVRQSDASAGF
jgi:hypothetical protein